MSSTIACCFGAVAVSPSSHGQKGNTGKPAMTRSFVPLLVATLFLAAASFTNARQTGKFRRSDISERCRRS